MPKNFDSKKKIKAETGKDIYEVTKTVKIKHSPDKVLKLIENIDKSITKLSEERLKLQELYDELTA